jgi:hypothetical protein
MIEFNLDFYNVVKCGYFERGEAQPDFGNINDLFMDFDNWIDGKSIQLTKTFERGKYLNRLPIYCYDFFRSDQTRDILLVTWNETMNDDGNVYSISGNSQVGQSEINSTPVPIGNIPGYATYFWFITELNLLCSIRPESQALNGHDNLKVYLKNFLEISPSFTLYDDGVISGYTDNFGFGAKPVLPKFETRMKYRDTQIEAIRNSVHDIRKIIIKNKLTLQDEVKRGFMRSILDNLFLPDRNPTVIENTDYRLEFDFEPTIEDLNQIINGWNQAGDESDIGFLFTGGAQSPTWLSHTSEKHQIMLDINRDPGEAIPADTLYTELNRQRANLLERLA